jgi:hypothetical protein
MKRRLLSISIIAAIILASSFYAAGMSPPVYTDKVDKITGTDNAAIRSDGTTGDIQDSTFIIGDDGKVEAKNATAEVFFSAEESAGFVGALMYLKGTAVNKSAYYVIEAKDATAVAGIFFDFGGTSHGQIVADPTNGLMRIASENTATANSLHVSRDSGQVAGGAGNSGDILDTTGSSAGGTRGSYKSDTYGVIHKLGDATGVAEVLITDSGDAEVFSVDSDGNTSIGGSITISRTAVADAGHTAANGEYLIAYTSLTATRTVALPTAVGRTGQAFLIKDESGSAAPGVKITIDPDGIETIDGVATIDIVTPYGAIEAYSSGAAWFTK